MNKNISGVLAMTAALAMSEQTPFYHPGGLTIRNGVKRIHNPWDTVQLTKSERRGKTYEEIQEMRKARYFEARKAGGGV